MHCHSLLVLLVRPLHRLGQCNSPCSTPSYTIGVGSKVSCISIDAQCLTEPKGPKVQDSPWKTEVFLEPWSPRGAEDSQADERQPMSGQIRITCQAALPPLPKHNNNGHKTIDVINPLIRLITSPPKYKELFGAFNF